MEQEGNLLPSHRVRGFGSLTPEEAQEAPGTEPLPVALNIKALYEQMMLPIIGNAPRKGEPLGEMVERLDLARKKQNELKKLQSRLKKEKQFNRKVEINAEIRTLSAELEGLNG